LTEAIIHDLPTGDQRFLKQLNRSAVLNTLRHQPGLSRAELAAQTGLTKVTVGSVVQELLRTGWLDEGELQQGALGRPGRSLNLDEQRHVLLGAEVGVLGLRAVACSLSGRLLAHSEVAAPTGSPDEAAAGVAHLVRELLAHPDVQGRTVLGLGVALPGPVDQAMNRLLFAPNLAWSDVPFLALLEPHLPGLPGLRHLDNEANAAAFGLAYLRPEAAPDLLAYLSLGSGVGAGLVSGLVSGSPQMEVLRGAHGLSGEIGHTLIQPGGLYCHCGNRGCVETLLGGWAIRASLGVNALEPLDSALNPRLREAAVQVVLSRAGEALGVLLVNLCQTLNPSEIVIGGALTRLGGPLMDTALDIFATHQSRRPAGTQVAVTVRPDSGLLPALGAAAQVHASAIVQPEVRA
jgi:predicted NBD/HSP70 family sugar kinase